MFIYLSVCVPRCASSIIYGARFSFLSTFSLEDDDDGDDDDDEFFRQGESIGLEESRNMEFKLCENGNTQTITRHCCSYICAFLNSDGGTLYFGVKESTLSGKKSVVIGMQNFRNEKKRDLLRGQIVSSLLQMRPAVNCVSPRIDIEFIPVSFTDRFVLRIRVEPNRMVHGRPLYATSNNSYVRNDHGIVNMTPQMILNWARERHSKDSKRLNSGGRYRIYFVIFSFILGRFAPTLYSNRHILFKKLRKWSLVFVLYLIQYVTSMKKRAKLLLSSSSSRRIF